MIYLSRNFLINLLRSAAFNYVKLLEISFKFREFEYFSNLTNFQRFAFNVFEASIPQTSLHTCNLIECE